MKPRIALTLAACVLAAAAAGVGGAPLKEDDPVKKDLALLQGTWVIVGKEYMGKTATKEEVAKLTGETVINDGTRTEWSEDLGKKEIINEAKLKLDPNAKPKALDIIITSGLGKGETIQAIYEVTGDTLKICFAMDDGKRPTEFAGKADGKAAFLTYKRLKK
jgi:uncharacterized protein (TIGR03067 family)